MVMLKFGRIAVVSTVALILAAGAIPTKAEAAHLLPPRPVVRHSHSTVAEHGSGYYGGRGYGGVGYDGGSYGGYSAGYGGGGYGGGY